MQSRTPRSKTSGVSLVESMISVALFGLTLLGAALAFSAAIQSQKRARFTGFATQVLRDQVERTRTLPASTVAGFGASATLTLPSPFSSHPLSARSTLTRSVASVTNFPGLVEITYTLRHDNPSLPLQRSTSIRYHANGIAALVLPPAS